MFQLDLNGALGGAKPKKTSPAGSNQAKPAGFSSSVFDLSGINLSSAPSFGATNFKANAMVPGAIKMDDQEDRFSSLLEAGATSLADNTRSNWASPPTPMTNQPVASPVPAYQSLVSPSSSLSASSSASSTGGFGQEIDWSAYVDHYEDLGREYGAFATRPGGYAFGPNLPASWDRNRNGKIDRGEYGEWHFKTLGQFEKRLSHGWDAQPQQAPSTPTAEDVVNDLTDESKGRSDDLEVEIANRDAELEALREQMRALEASANAPGDQGDMELEQLRHQNQMELERLRMEEARALRDQDYARQQELEQMRLDAEAREREIEAEALRAKTAADERARIVRDGDLYATQAQELMRRIRGSQDYANPYGESGYYTLRDQRDRLLDQINNYQTTLTDASPSEIGRFSRAISALEGFDDALSSLSSRREAALADIEAQAEEALARLQESPLYDEDAINSIQSDLQGLSQDLSAFGLYGTDSASEDLDTALSALRQKRSELTEKRRAFTESASGRASGFSGRAFYNRDELSAFGDELSAQRAEAQKYGADAALRFYDMMDARLSQEEARLARDAEIVRQREAAERDDFQRQTRDGSPNPFSRFAFGQSEIFDDMSPQDYLSYILSQNPDRRFVGADGEAAAVPTAFSRILAG